MLVTVQMKRVFVIPSIITTSTGVLVTPRKRMGKTELLISTQKRTKGNGIPIATTHPFVPFPRSITPLILRTLSPSALSPSHLHSDLSISSFPFTRFPFLSLSPSSPASHNSSLFPFPFRPPTPVPSNSPISPSSFLLHSASIAPSFFCVCGAANSVS